MKRSNIFHIINLISLLVWSPSVWTASVAGAGDEATRNIDLLMPDVQPKVVDSYLCYATKIESPVYITGFLPKAKMEIAHHVLLYGCKVPGSTEHVWDCGEMHAQQFQQAPVCAEGTNIVYAWAMDAPDLHLPDGVGFKVGGDSAIQWIVLQVHYKDVEAFLPPRSETDHSGVTLITTENKQPRRAGVYLMGTSGEIAPHSTTYMETACSFNDPIVLHPFAFRTHAHTHGRVIAGYRVRNGEWKEIGRKSPQLPQMFYNVTNPGMTIESGDLLAARCTMVNDENITISIGATSKDEMCNFYMMYYVDGDQLSGRNTCFSLGPPEWNWFLLQDLHSENAPLDASIVPGTTELLKSTQKFFNEVKQSMDQDRQNFEDRIERIMSVLQGYGKEADINESPEDYEKPMSERDDGVYQGSYDSNGIDTDHY